METLRAVSQKTKNANIGLRRSEHPCHDPEVSLWTGHVPVGIIFVSAWCMLSKYLSKEKILTQLSDFYPFFFFSGWERGREKNNSHLLKKGHKSGLDFQIFLLAKRVSSGGICYVRKTRMFANCCGAACLSLRKYQWACLKCTQYYCPH